MSSRIEIRARVRSMCWRMSYDEDWSGWLRSGFGSGGNTAGLVGEIGGKGSRLKVLPLQRTMFCAETSELRKGGGEKIVDCWFWKIVDCLSWEEGLEDFDCWFWEELIKGRLKLGGSGLRNGTRMFDCRNGLKVEFRKGGREVHTRGGSLERVWTLWALSKPHTCLPWGRGTFSSGFRMIATLGGCWGFWFWPCWGTGAWF